MNASHTWEAIGLLLLLILVLTSLLTMTSKDPHGTLSLLHVCTTYGRRCRLYRFCHYVFSIRDYLDRKASERQVHFSAKKFHLLVAKVRIALAGDLFHCKFHREYLISTTVQIVEFLLAWYVIGPICYHLNKFICFV